MKLVPASYHISEGLERSFGHCCAKCLEYQAGPVKCKWALGYEYNKIKLAIAVMGGEYKEIKNMRKDGVCSRFTNGR